MLTNLCLTMLKKVIKTMNYSHGIFGYIRFGQIGVPNLGKVKESGKNILDPPPDADLDPFHVLPPSFMVISNKRPKT